MAIERNPSIDNRPVEQNREVSKDKPREKDAPAPPREQMDRFSNLLQGKGEGKELRQELKELKGQGEQGRAEGSTGQATADTQQRVGGVDQHDAGGRQQDRQTADIGKPQSAESAAMLHVQQAIHANNTGLPNANPHAGGGFNPQAFSEMVEKHVKQLAAGRDERVGDDGTILLRMNDATLPGTDLLLKRNGEGRWTLQADTTSRDSYQAISRAVPSLARRFAAAGLGEINVESQFNG